MKLEDLLNKKIIVLQIKGGSKLNDKQKGSLVGLGLKGVGSSAEVIVDNAILGMIKKVFHIVKIKNS